MKKLLCVLLATSMLLLGACSSTETNSSDDVVQTEQTETAESFLDELVEKETTEPEVEEKIAEYTDEDNGAEYEEEVESEEIEETEEIEGPEETVGEEYILNTNSNKIHYPWCKSVNKMKESNKKYVKDTVDNLMNKGYSPCGNCKPN